MRLSLARLDIFYIRYSMAIWRHFNQPGAMSHAEHGCNHRLVPREVVWTETLATKPAIPPGGSAYTSRLPGGTIKSRTGIQWVLASQGLQTTAFEKFQLHLNIFLWPIFRYSYDVFLIYRTVSDLFPSDYRFRISFNEGIRGRVKSYLASFNFYRDWMPAYPKKILTRVSAMGRERSREAEVGRRLTPKNGCCHLSTPAV